jgi:hypothetical protein
MVDKCSAT